MIRFDILTVFPEMFTSFCGCSLLKKALDKGLISIGLHDIRNHTGDKHRMTDDAPYGGGGGMVMKVEPIDKALQSIQMVADEVPIVLLTPQGERFCQKIAEEMAVCPQLLLVCGHYEGVDQRFVDKYVDEELSIGDYVLTGGELPAMVLVDAVVRLVEGGERQGDQRQEGVVGDRSRMQREVGFRDPPSHVGDRATPVRRGLHVPRLGPRSLNGWDSLPVNGSLGRAFTEGSDLGIRSHLGSLLPGGGGAGPASSSRD